MKIAIVLGGIAVLLAGAWVHYRISTPGVLVSRRPLPLAFEPGPMRPPAKPVYRSAGIKPASPVRVEPEIAQAPAESDFADSINSLLTNTEPHAIETRRGLIRQWAESNPAAAAAWMARLPPGLFQDAAQQLVIAWAETDPEAASQWLSTLPNGDAKRAASISLAYEAARDNPLMAVGLAVGLPPTPQRDDLLVHATSQWARLDLQSALGWAEQVPATDLRQRLIAAIATASAKLDGAAAAAMVANLIPPGDQQNRAAVAVAQRWAESAPQAANEWVARYPEGPVREAATRSLMEVSIAQQSSPAGQASPEVTIGGEP